MHDPVGFAWRATVEARERGELSFTFDGSARRSFDYRRIGVCVLHPWRAYVGATYEATTPLGPRRGTFPMRDRAPGPRRRLVPADDRGVLAPRGDVHRAVRCWRLTSRATCSSWRTSGTGPTASFKTYPTPLARSETRRMMGGRARSAARCRSDSKVRRRPRPSRIVPSVSVGGRTGRVVPPIGMSVTSEPIEGAQHVKVPLVAADPDLDALAQAHRPIELALARRRRPRRPSIGSQHACVTSRSPASSSRAPTRRRRREISSTRSGRALGLEGVPFAGGTSTFFSELNRNPPERDDARRRRVRDQPRGARHRRAIDPRDPRDPGAGARAGA